jgi:hypothetical protein
MAAQIGLLFARQLGVPVVLTDLDQARVDSGVGYVHGEIGKLLDRQRAGSRPIWIAPASPKRSPAPASAEAG